MAKKEVKPQANHFGYDKIIISAVVVIILGISVFLFLNSRMTGNVVSELPQPGSISITSASVNSLDNQTIRINLEITQEITQMLLVLIDSAGNEHYSEIPAAGNEYVLSASDFNLSSFREIINLKILYNNKATAETRISFYDSTKKQLEETPEQTTPGNPANESVQVVITPKTSTGGGGGGGGGGGTSGGDTNPIIPTCENDVGCSEAGGFCDGNKTYTCTLDSATGCLIKQDLAECNSSTSCYAGFCLDIIMISACLNLNETGSKYLLTQNITNNTLITPCLNISAEAITLDCNNFKMSSTRNFPGVYSDQSQVTIKNCNIDMGASSGGFAIQLENSQGNLIENNSLHGSYTGIYLVNVTDSAVEENNASLNDNRGVHLSSSRNNTLLRNTAESNNFYGILFSKSSENTISENRILKNYDFGLLIEASLDSTPDGYNRITNNFFALGDMNVYIKTSNNVIKDNIINESQFYHGLYIYNATNNSIENNTIDSSYQYGIRLRYSSNTLVKNNKVTNSQDSGLYVDGSSSITIQDNQLCSNIQDVYCDLDQTFQDNYCDSGDVCGGSCISCAGIGGMSLGESSITGHAVDIDNQFSIWNWIKKVFGW